MRRIFATLWLASCLVVPLVGVWAPAALAHAMLVESTPVEGSRLAEGPSSVAVVFNEPVVPIFMRVVGEDGRSLAALAVPSPAAERFSLAVPSGIPMGRYFLTYRVVSADSHPVSGSIAFGIGVDPGRSGPEPAADTRRSTDWTLVSVVVRALRDATLAIAAGFVAFAGLFGRRLGERQHLLVSVWAGIAALLSILGIVAAGGRIAEVELAQIGVAWAFGSASTAGLAGFVGVGACIFAALAVRAGNPAVAFAALFAAAGATAVTGHATAATSSAAIQFAHSLFAFGWIGALSFLVHAGNRLASAELAALARSFTRIAIPGVALLAVAGTALAASRIGSIDLLLSSGYGRLVLAKVAVFCVLVLIAADNRRLARNGFASGTRRFRRNVAVELGLAVGIVALTAVLSHTPPPGTEPAARGGAPDAEAQSATFAGSGLSVSVGIAGDLLEIFVADMDGNLIAAEALEATLALPERQLEGLVRAGIVVEPGHFWVREPALRIAGRWRLSLGIQLDEFRKPVIAGEIDVRAAAP
jgi:copper transport protein